MKVLQIGKYYPPDRGGMETHLADLCQELKDEVELDVLVSHKQAQTVEDMVDGVRVTRLAAPLNILANPVNPGLAGRIRRSDADLVHLHWPNPLALLSYLSSGSKAPLVITYHSDIVRQKLTGKLFQPVLDKALASALIIATSPNYVESSSCLQKFRENCRVVPLGIDPEKLSQYPAELKRKYKEQFGERMILATGRHVSYKGFSYLIEAMSAVNGKLALAGDGPLRKELEALAVERKVTDKVTFLGQVSDEQLRALYAACSVFAFPSIARSEAFGLVQLEAMAAGKPVVNTDVDSGVPYVSVHGQTGITVPKCDATALARQLNALLDNEHLRYHYGDQGRRRVYENFTLSRMRERTLAIYEEALTGKRQSVREAGRAA